MKKIKNNPDHSLLRVLILEDNPADAELIERALRHGKINFTSRLVERKREFIKALADFKPQVILSDFKLPAFDGLAALESARTKAPDVPFIFVSGSIGEEKAIGLLAQGASDYIFKDNLQRLGPAVKRVVEAVRLKLAKKKTDEKLQEHVEELRLLAEAADFFVQTNDLDQIYDYIAEVIREIAGADYLLLSVYDQALQAVRPKKIVGGETYLETIRSRFNIDPMQMVFHFKDMSPNDFSDFVSRRLLPARNGLYGLANRKLPRQVCRAIEKLLAISTMFTMGFSWENQLYGGVTIMFKKGNELKNHTQIETLLNQAAVSIKRLLAEKSLRDSEERFRHISETISDISYSCLSDAGNEYSLSWMTGAVDRITGYSFEEIMSMKCWGKLVLTEDFPDFEKYVIGLTPGNSGICEMRLRHKNGNIVWVQSFAECSQNREPPEQRILFGGLMDISERKRAENALRESEKKYRTIVTQSPDGIFIANLQGNFISVNQAMCASMKYSEAEFLVMNIRDIVPERYLELHKIRLAEIMKGKPQNEAAEYEVKAKDGEIHCIAIFSAPYYEDKQLIGFQGIARDVTEKKKMEDRLRESEQYYRTLVETSPDAIIIVDAGGRCTFASSKTHEVFGIPAQLSIIGISIMDFVEPDEVPRVQERLVEILSGRSLPEIREYRLLRHDRRPFWGEVSSAPLHDTAGRSIGLLLIIRDISERVRIEAALRESEEKYRLITENTADTITVLDLDLKFTYVSPSIFRLRGFAVEEALEQTLEETLTRDSLARIREVFGEEMALEMSGSADPQRSRSLELQEFRKDGSIVWVENSMSFLRDPLGKPIGILAVSKDISERKRAETIQIVQYKIANSMVTAESFANFFETIRKELGTLFDATNFLVALFDKKNGMLFAPFNKNEKDVIPEWPAEKSLTGLVIRRKHSMLLNKNQIQQMVEAGTIELIGSRAESWLGVPLLINEKILGAIVVQSYDQADAYDQNAISILEMVASQASVYIERRQAEEQRQSALAALRESEDRYRDLVENSLDIICTHDLEGKMLSVNESASRLTGYSRDDLLNMNMINLLAPGVRHLFKAYLEEIRFTGRAQGTMRIQTSAGNIRHWEFSNTLRTKGVPVPFVRAVAHDITERDMAEAEIMREKAFLEKLVESAPEGIAITDCPGLVLRVNSEFVNMFGYAAEEIVGKNIDDLIVPPGYLEEAGAITQSVGAGKPNALETVRKRKNGTLLNVSIIGAPIHIGEQQVAVYAIYRDISERKRSEEQIRASLKEKEVLLQEIHHRVKNNLQIISGLLTLQADQSAGKSLDEIFRASQDRIRSIALIHEKLYQSHNLAEIAFDEYLRALVDNLLISHSIAAGRITTSYVMERILFTIEKAIPLGLIVNELVTNALKHAFPAGQQGEIRIGLHGYKGAKSYALKTDSGTLHIVPTCELIVADNGIGFPAGQVLEQQKTLGMKLVSMLAKQLQAELEIKTGPGTEFRLLFPGLPASETVKDKDHGG